MANNDILNAVSIRVHAPDSWVRDYSVTMFTVNRLGTIGVWAKNGETPRDALTKVIAEIAEKNGTQIVWDEIPHDDYRHPSIDQNGQMCPICNPETYISEVRKMIENNDEYVTMFTNSYMD